MRLKRFFINWTFLAMVFAISVSGSDIAPTADDPLMISKKIIADEPLAWSSDEYASVVAAFAIPQGVKDMDRNYLLLQSPWLGPEYLLGVFSDGKNTIPVEQLLDLLNLATNSPQLTSRKLAEVTLQEALLQYKEAYAIAKELKANGPVSYEEAITFLNNRFSYLKIKTATKLLNQSNLADNAVIDKKTTKRISDHFRSIRKQYSDEIPITNALKEVETFYTLLEEVVSGLATVKPYTDFTQTITELNEVQIRERKHWRSVLEITYPTSGTTWTLPDNVSIEWNTVNLPKDKTIRFYLLKNNTVIQDLGAFKNEQLAEGIKISKALPEGNNYRIMGIELFPADKFHTAKFATPYFTIKKRAADAPIEKEKEVVAEVPKKEPEAIVEKTTIPIEEEPLVEEKAIDTAIERETIAAPAAKPPVAETISEPVTEIPEPPKEVEKRTDFDGRKITYVKELEVSSRIVRINLWDHGRQDGDIVSIYLNGVAIVSQYTLTYVKKGFELKLDPTQANDLFLYAHNLGTFPPNTVSIEIIDGDTSENIILNSDLSRCEAVLINVKE